MKSLTLHLITGASLMTVLPLFAQKTTFASRVGDRTLQTTLTKEMFKQGVPSSLYTEVDGKMVWSVAAGVTLAEAREIATEEARRVLGAEYRLDWDLREAGRRVSGYNDHYLHHYHFGFSPRRAIESGNFQVIVLLDGTLLPAEETK